MSRVDLEPCAHCGGPLIDGSSFWLDPTGEGIHTGCEEQRRYEGSVGATLAPDVTHLDVRAPRDRGSTGRSALPSRRAGPERGRRVRSV